MSARNECGKSIKFAGQSVVVIDAKQHIPSRNEQKICRKELQGTLDLLVEYCDTGSVHGSRYFFDKKRHWLERLWWIFSFVLALFCCGKLIQNLYIKWDHSPVIVSFAEQTTPIWKVPFPTVTICPKTKVNVTQLNITRVWDMLNPENPSYNITDEEEELIYAVAQLCNFKMNKMIGNNFTDGSILQLLRNTAPKIDDTMMFCGFRNVWKKCNTYFEEIMTEEGLCFTFNALNGSEMYKEALDPDCSTFNHNMSSKFWSLDKGYDHSIGTDPETYPYRAFDASASTEDFHVLLKSFKHHVDHICTDGVQGFKIFLRSPGEIPQGSKNYIIVPIMQEVWVLVKPKMVTTSESLRAVDPDRRQCYFQSERELRFTKVYTQRNCELECISNFTLRECGCVKFSMLRAKDTPICGSAKINCYDHAKKKFFREKLKASTVASDNERVVKDCMCLPACTTITYDTEVMQMPFEWIKIAEPHFEPDRYNLQVSELRILFKDDEFISLKRSELYGPTDFLANCGGLIGLFVGASVLSIVELFYFFSLRLWCNLRTRMNGEREEKFDGAALPEIVVVKPVNRTENVTKNMVKVD